MSPIDNLYAFRALSNHGILISYRMKILPTSKWSVKYVMQHSSALALLDLASMLVTVSQTQKPLDFLTIVAATYLVCIASLLSVQ